MTHRLYSDENFPLHVIEELRHLGHDVLTMHEDGKANQSIPDDEVLAVAAREQRALLTIKRRHFISLHRRKMDHSGIIVCTFDPDFPGQARRITEAIENLPDLAGKLIRVYRPS